MPAEKLPSGPPTRSVTAPAYSIVGMYSEPTEKRFVRHVAILAEESSLESGKRAAVWHMGPPLVSGERTKKRIHGAQIESVHLSGRVPLDLDQMEGIKDWLEEVDKESAPEDPFKRYLVRPHCVWHIAPETDRPLYRRFSCVGFVLECYKSVDIDLVNTEESDLPEVDFETLVKAYPGLGRDELLLQRAMRGVTRDDLGIAGEGPWRIVLAGYVFHALERVPSKGPIPETFTPRSVIEAHFPA